MKIGLEIHVQLPTKSKMFCSCPTTDAPAPNTHVCPTCLGMPGSRPVLNRKVLEYGIMLAKMLGCKVADTAWFSRKTYFYPDMSKSVQITQYDNPIGEGGVYMLNGKKPIRITRIHVEEDPGKTKRVGDLSSLVDYNRSGIPLAEIVTEPDLSTPAEAREFLGQLIADIRHVIDLPGDGERSIRCDCNISVGKERCEVKNVTGLKNVERALTFEYIRQSKILKAGGKIERETRRFDEERGVTISVRKKEFEADYGYIDEPDLGIYHIKAMADAIKIRESPQQMAARMVSEYGIDQKMAKQLIATSVSVAELFERVARETDVQNAVKWVAGPVSAHWKSLQEGDDASDDIVAAVRRFAAGEITDAECGMQIKCRLTGEDAEAAAAGSADLEALIEQVIAENPGVVADYAKNDKAINKVIGSVMRQSGGKYSSAEVVGAAKRILESKMQRTVQHLAHALGASHFDRIAPGAVKRERKGPEPLLSLTRSRIRRTRRCPGPRRGR
ncbi:MAG: Asp-tRNA(Asn)/Glu-tRNA(Gln) amidotransferase subunit GatB [Candidatus Methanomethylophilaceae archaeon]|jgi:aspartyl-tRNA(Asn)/glutamyl-tRNA(Gln) amidotransferase subunit B|nr:Asp-tRNA(Asn)/Glu-tRNA(Gln) amidotransferase subunit GatB [Thermoplasmata archaeon]MBQ3685558.1 Asp-tRNA(Asn)/Glu-tRNA(Gln) amidotransferase subunit GatB [Candidatus Methanomethylophilaceae archaeon]